MSELYHVVMDNNYLAHHGIKGQQWGVRNGPPYPLDRMSTSALKKKREKYAKKLDAWKSGKASKQGAVGAAIATGALTTMRNKASGASTGASVAGGAISGAISGGITYGVSKATSEKIMTAKYQTRINNVDAELKRRGESSRASSVVSRNSSKSVSSLGTKSSSKTNTKPSNKTFQSNKSNTSSKSSSGLVRTVGMGRLYNDKDDKRMEELKKQGYKIIIDPYHDTWSARTK